MAVWPLGRRWQRVRPTFAGETGENVARKGTPRETSTWAPQASSELFKLFPVFKEVFQFLKNVVKKYQPLLTPSLYAFLSSAEQAIFPETEELWKCLNMCQVSYK